ncbi:MAG TPA: YceI family protein [Cyclobacteriaceae bacterium]|nr:YceI family protein [Cyclobacteriaceae bacterium]
MKKLLSVLVLALFSSTGFAQSTWTADNAHSKLAFSTVHLGISDVAGLFNEFDATIVASEDNFSDAVFDLTVDVASIDTEVKMRDDHLRSADFFNVEKFPKMTYKSTSIKKAGKDRYKLTGDLTLHGITKPVTMELWYRGTIENPQNGAVTSGFQLTGTLNRSDFNIGPDFPELMISDEVKIKADGEFIKQ